MILALTRPIILVIHWNVEMRPIPILFTVKCQLLYVFIEFTWKAHVHHLWMTYINTLFIQQVAVFFLFNFRFPPIWGIFEKDSLRAKTLQSRKFYMSSWLCKHPRGRRVKSSLSQAPLSKDGRETLVGRVLTLLTNMRRQSRDTIHWRDIPPINSLVS